MRNINLNMNVMHKLITTIDLLGKVNSSIAKMGNPYLLTYILEGVDTISSNEVENIHTTIDEAANDIIINNSFSPYVRYRETLKQAHRRLISSEIIRSKDIEWINKNVRGQKTGFRKTPVTITDKNKCVIHKGANAQEIPGLIVNLTKDINDEHCNTHDAIVKSLLIHHKFEQIHPFTDGNGRTGRIILALLFTKYKILDMPASVFSYSVLKNKEKYYKALRLADKNEYNKYLEIMLEILNQSLKISIVFAKKLWEKYLEIKSFDKIVSNKLLLKLLPYCFAAVKVSIKYLQKKTSLNNKTITKYLKILEDYNIMEQEVKGRFRPYKNLVIEKLINNYFI